MQRQRGELVPIGEVAISGLDDVLPRLAIREESPQSRHSLHALADQVNQLGQRPAKRTPALGFMARTMALCSLPRTNPGDRKEYKRGNGPY